MKIERDKMIELTEHLNGTCQTLAAACEVFSLDEEQAASQLDEYEVVCCETCGWWVEQSEVDEDENCEDCHAEKFEEWQENV